MPKVIKVEKDFDVLLGGGLSPKTITHIYGVPASGKTNFALMATSSAAAEGKVIYVDSEGGFSPERLQQISGRRFLDVLKNVILVEPADFDEQKIALKKLEEIIVSQAEVSLIVIDSISVLYRLEEERDMKELGRQLAQLLRISRKYDIPVLVVNQVYTELKSDKIAPIGGDLSRYWSKIMLEFEKDDATGLRCAVVRKHKFLPEGIRLNFRINDNGIESYGIKYPQDYTAYKKEDEIK